MRKTVLIIVGVFVALFLIGSWAGSDTTEKIGPINTPEPEPVEVQATKLYQDYKENEIAADDKYAGRPITVIGTVDNIGKDIVDNPYVAFKGGEYLGTVQCMLAENEASKAATLKEGQIITAKGADTSFLITQVIIRNCVILSELE